MAAARIRKAFHYPRDSDDEDEPEEMDEEHQERLISELRREDALKNEMYRTGFLALPLLGVAFFVYALFTSTTARQSLISAMSISSLVCTAYILQYMPIHSPERKGKRPLYQIEAEEGPVEKYLVYLNAALAAILLLAAMSQLAKKHGTLLGEKHCQPSYLVSSYLLDTSSRLWTLKHFKKPLRV